MFLIIALMPTYDKWALNAVKHLFAFFPNPSIMLKANTIARNVLIVWQIDTFPIVTKCGPYFFLSSFHSISRKEKKGAKQIIYVGGILSTLCSLPMKILSVNRNVISFRPHNHMPWNATQGGLNEKRNRKSFHKTLIHYYYYYSFECKLKPWKFQWVPKGNNRN